MAKKDELITTLEGRGDIKVTIKTITSTYFTEHIKAILQKDLSYDEKHAEIKEFYESVKFDAQEIGMQAQERVQRTYPRVRYDIILTHIYEIMDDCFIRSMVKNCNKWLKGFGDLTEDAAAQLLGIKTIEEPIDPLAATPKQLAFIDSLSHQHQFKVIVPALKKKEAAAIINYFHHGDEENEEIREAIRRVTDHLDIRKLYPNIPFYSFDWLSFNELTTIVGTDSTNSSANMKYEQAVIEFDPGGSDHRWEITTEADRLRIELNGQAEILSIIDAFRNAANILEVQMYTNEMSGDVSKELNRIRKL